MRLVWVFSHEGAERVVQWQHSRIVSKSRFLSGSSRLKMQVLGCGCWAAGSRRICPEFDLWRSDPRKLSGSAHSVATGAGLEWGPAASFVTWRAIFCCQTPAVLGHEERRQSFRLWCWSRRSLLQAHNAGERVEAGNEIGR